MYRDPVFLGFLVKIQFKRRKFFLNTPFCKAKVLHESYRASWRNVWIRLLSCSPDREAKVTVFARFREEQRCHILLAIFSRHRQKFLLPRFPVDWKQPPFDCALFRCSWRSLLSWTNFIWRKREVIFMSNLRSKYRLAIMELIMGLTAVFANGNITSLC